MSHHNPPTAQRAARILDEESEHEMLIYLLYASGAPAGAHPWQESDTCSLPDGSAVKRNTQQDPAQYSFEWTDPDGNLLRNTRPIRTTQEMSLDEPSIRGSQDPRHCTESVMLRVMEAARTEARRHQGYPGYEPDEYQDDHRELLAMHLRAPLARRAANQALEETVVPDHLRATLEQLYTRHAIENLPEQQFQNLVQYATLNTPG